MLRSAAIVTAVAPEKLWPRDFSKLHPLSLIGLFSATPRSSTTTWAGRSRSSRQAAVVGCIAEYAWDRMVRLIWKPLFPSHSSDLLR